MIRGGSSLMWTGMNEGDDGNAVYNFGEHLLSTHEFLSLMTAFRNCVPE
jgi:hypothetical protein